MQAALKLIRLGLLPALLMSGAFGPLRAAAEDTTRYDVEVLVFAALRGDDGGERAPTSLEQPDTGNAVQLGSGGGILPLLEGPRNLQAVAESMRRSSQYRPLLHWRWRQPGWERGAARSIQVQIPSGASLPVTDLPQAVSPYDRLLLNGTLTLSRSRYLHFTADLVYDDPATGVSTRMRETRRMRSNELHYLDNPRIGILVRAIPYEPIQSEPVQSP